MSLHDEVLSRDRPESECLSSLRDCDDTALNAVSPGEQCVEHIAHGNGHVVEVHGLLERYCASQLSAYVIVESMLVSKGHEYLVVFKHGVMACSPSKTALAIRQFDETDSDDPHGNPSMLIGVIQVLKNPQLPSPRAPATTHHAFSPLYYP